jgi:hypothetical protein
MAVGSIAGAMIGARLLGWVDVQALKHCWRQCSAYRLSECGVHGSVGSGHGPRLWSWMNRSESAVPQHVLFEAQS